MMKKNSDSGFGINFEDFTVPIVSEAEISAACDKIAESLPVIKTGFNINLHRYGLIAICAMLMVAVITIVPELIAPEFKDTDLDSHKTEILESAEDKTENNLYNSSVTESDMDKGIQAEDTTAQPAGAARAPSPSDTGGGRWTAKDTIKESKSSDRTIKNTENKSEPSHGSSGSEASATGGGYSSKSVPMGEAPPPDEGIETIMDKKASSDVVMNGVSDASPKAPEAAGGAAASDDMSVTPGDSRSLAMSAPVAPEGARIETELTAGEHEGMVLLSTGFLNFKEIPEGEKAPATIQNVARVETWTVEKFTAEFGINPSSNRLPEDMVLTPASIDQNVSVRIMGYGKSEAYKVVFQYLGKNSRSLTFDIIKRKGESDISAEEFNSNINGYNIYAEYIKESDGCQRYSARLYYQGVEYNIYSVNLTQEEFINALLSVFESE